MRNGLLCLPEKPNIEPKMSFKLFRRWSTYLKLEQLRSLNRS